MSWLILCNPIQVLISQCGLWAGLVMQPLLNKNYCPHSQIQKGGCQQGRKLQTPYDHGDISIKKLNWWNWWTDDDELDWWTIQSCMMTCSDNQRMCRERSSWFSLLLLHFPLGPLTTTCTLRTLSSASAACYTSPDPSTSTVHEGYMGAQGHCTYY